ncbi:hypothetical protein Gasu_60570 isoform 1 [Galdieria sulphuraria]|uniref:Uncharacterized protein n=1 Tax=Galdieria sulphuraria TaxID=130081 RepID=M2XSE6_GALSU|nr:hypothetical protein Gasu_60570 isoform 1 [Galdieria sulphuraria]EME26329.1 hypothetical protein isoform 1 [Galdieria sulphuraria]|eukprot:XP_005702849.1 hypothetical protein isoform 1 [Galdieria sulphuraria]
MSLTEKNISALPTSVWVGLFHDYPRLGGNNTLEFTEKYAIHQFYTCLPWLISGAVVCLIYLLAVLVYTLYKRRTESLGYTPVPPSEIIRSSKLSILCRTEISTLLYFILFFSISLGYISTVSIDYSADEIFQVIDSAAKNFTDTANLATSSVHYFEQLVTSALPSSFDSSIESSLQQINSQVSSFVSSLNGTISTMNAVASYGHRVVYYSFIGVLIIISLQILAFYYFYYSTSRFHVGRWHIVHYISSIFALLLAWWCIALFIGLGTTVGDTCISLKQVDEYNSNNSLSPTLVQQNVFIQKGIVCPSLPSNVLDTVVTLASNLPTIESFLQLNNTQFLNELVPFLLDELATVTNCTILTIPLTTVYEQVCGPSISLVQVIAIDMFAFVCQALSTFQFISVCNS